MLQRAHVVKAIGEFDQNDAKVGDHRQQHFAERLGLLLFLRDERVARNLRDAIDELRDVVAEMLLESLLRRESVFQNIMEKADRDRRLVETHLREDVRDVQRMDEVWLARAAHLTAMLARRKDVRSLKQLLVEVRLVALDFVEDVLEADHGLGRCNKPFMLAVPPIAPQAGPSLAHLALGGRTECPACV